MLYKVQAVADLGIDQGRAEFLLPPILSHSFSSKIEGAQGGAPLFVGSGGAGASLDPPLAPSLSTNTPTHMTNKITICCKATTFFIGTE